MGGRGARCIARALTLDYIFPERPPRGGYSIEEETIMAWTTPTLVEICIGLEINGYLPAEF